MTPGKADAIDRPISIRRLKARFFRAYDPGEAIREVLAHEPDELTRRELLERLPTWVTLIRLADNKPEEVPP
jgi:hypothetical protein